MFLYVTGGQIYSERPKAVAAAKGNANAVKSFSNYFEAEAYASGGSFDAASSSRAITDAFNTPPPAPAPAPIRASVSRYSFQNRSFPPPAKRTKYESVVYRPKYSETSGRIRNALSEWTPHPDFAKALSTNTTEPSAPTKKSGHVEDPYQKRAIDAALKGKSFLLTGSAGVGKSYVLKLVIRKLREQGRKVVVCASTGCAAVGIQGSTLHSALKLGIGKDSPRVLCTRIRSQRMKNVRAELQAMDVLVIDEISMVDKTLFENAEAVVRSARCTLPGHPVRCTLCPLFGSVQVILCGDFFQLPPVASANNEPDFCFKSKIFQKLIRGKVYRLRRVHRQDDFKFVGMLNELRMGVCTKQTSNVLQRCLTPGGLRHEEYDDKDQPLCFTKLYPYREQVRRENEGELRKLRTPGAVFSYWITKYPNHNPKVVEAGLKNLRVDHEIVLRVGARILCLKNLSVEEGICNGSPGRIIGFYPAALTISEISDIEKGTAEVAVRIGANLSEEWQKAKSDQIGRGVELNEFARRARVRSQESSKPEVIDVDELPTNKPKADKEDNDVSKLLSKRASAKEYAILKDAVSAGKEYLDRALKHPRLGLPQLGEAPIVVPVVQFDNGLVRRIFPEPFEIRSANGNLEARVYQLPICLGYALSVHKSQGMTLSRVLADLGGAFDCGQVYVALSRVSTVEGLRLSSFDSRKVMVHDAVRQFDRELNEGKYCST